MFFETRLIRNTGFNISWRAVKVTNKICTGFSFHSNGMHAYYKISQVQVSEVWRTQHLVRVQHSEQSVDHEVQTSSSLAAIQLNFDWEIVWLNSSAKLKIITEKNSSLLVMSRLFGCCSLLGEQKLTQHFYSEQRPKYLARNWNWESEVKSKHMSD